MSRYHQIWNRRTTDEVRSGSLTNGVLCQSKAYFCYCWLLQLQNRFILIFKNVLEISNFENVNFELGFSCFWHIPLSKASSTVVKLLPDCIRGHFLVRTGGKSTRFCSSLWYLQILSQNMLQHLALIWLAPEWIGASLILHTISSEEITLTIILVLLSIAKESNCGKVGWERHYRHLQSIL